jgi:hypothetical protein
MDQSGLGTSANPGATSAQQERQARDGRLRERGLGGTTSTNGQNNGRLRDQSGVQNGTGTNQQDWRQVYYDNHWWYYTPSNNWMYYDSNRWNPYRNTTQTPVPDTGTNGTYNGQYGVGYRGDANADSNGNSQLDTNRNGQAGRDIRGRNYSPNTSNGGSNRSMGQRSFPSQRPSAPTESDLRIFEQQNFGNSATGINSATDRTQQSSPANSTAAPGMGVDATGIPIQSGGQK